MTTPAMPRRVLVMHAAPEASGNGSGAERKVSDAEPVSAYVTKGGHAEDVDGRKCICNALVATMGLPQVRGRALEPPIITSGDSVRELASIAEGRDSYHALDVIRHLLSRLTPGASGSSA